MLNVQQINKNTDLLAMAGNVTRLAKVAQTGGGEYAGACPFYGRCDSFWVQAFGKLGGRWFCRSSGGDRWHDAIDIDMRLKSVDFVTAARRLGDLSIAQHRQPAEEITLNKIQWAYRAGEFWDTTITHLWRPAGAKAVEWLHQRGLSDSTLKYWGIGYNPSTVYDPPEAWGFSGRKKSIYLPRGVVIVNIDGQGWHYVKIRRGGDSKFIMAAVSHMWPFGAETAKDKSSAFFF
jgi:DNA primase